MIWYRIQLRWHECRVEALRLWDRLTPSDCAEINGDRDRLIARVQASYAVTPIEAGRQVDAFASKLRLDLPPRDTPDVLDRPHPIGFMGTRYRGNVPKTGSRAMLRSVPVSKRPSAAGPESGGTYPDRHEPD